MTQAELKALSDHYGKLYKAYEQICIDPHTTGRSPEACAKVDELWKEVQAARIKWLRAIEQYDEENLGE
jgi:hypothetical protein